MIATETLTEQPAVETPKPLKLSEAMRIGSMTTKQAFGKWTGQDGSFCAIATAAHMYGVTSLSIVELLESRRVTWPECSHPTFSGKPGSLAGALVHVNDEHKWPRHKIADWLESIAL